MTFNMIELIYLPYIWSSESKLKINFKKEICVQVVGVVDITTLTNRQYCVILDPVDDKGRPQFGKKKLVKGEKSFFLMPGENLERGIQNIFVLGENEGIILKSNEMFNDQVQLIILWYCQYLLLIYLF